MASFDTESLVGAATLKTHDNHLQPQTHGMIGEPEATVAEAGGCGAVYLSGFKIVEDIAGKRHAEYKIVLLEAHYERWHRFSQLRALSRMPALAGDPLRETTSSRQQAWESVRACKAPEGRTLDRVHLSRKCLAIERFLSSLLEEMSTSFLAELLRQVGSAAPQSPHRAKKWAPIAYTEPRYILPRGTGRKMRMR